MQSNPLPHPTRAARNPLSATPRESHRMTSDRRGAPPSFEALSADDPHEIGGYRLCARLGSGGMGHVYLAFTPGGGRSPSRRCARSSPGTPPSATGSPRK